MTSNMDIINTYLKLSYENGADNVSLSNIAESLGIKKSTIFSHFKSFEDIKTSAVEYCMEKLSKTEFSLNLKAVNVSELMTSLFDTYLEMFTTEPGIYLLSIAEQKKTTDDYYKDISHRIDMIINARMLVTLEYCNQRSWTDIKNTDYASEIFSAAVRNTLIKKELPEWELDSLAKQILSLII